MKHELLLNVAPFSGARVLEFEGFMRYLSTGDLQNESISFVDITYKDRPSRADIAVKQGDVLFARMKGTKKVLEIDKELTGIVVSTGFAVVRPTNECNGKYLAIYIKSDDFERQKEKYCSGAIQPAITNAGIKKIKIPLPSLDDQIRIATLLSKVENLISRRREQLKQLDELLKSVFLEMFSPANRNFETWPLVEIKELAAKHKGAMRTGPFGSNLLHSEFSSTGDVAVMGIDNAVHNRFTWGDQRFITKEKYKELGSYRIYPGDVIITIMGTIGCSAVIPDDIPLAINTKHLAAITLDRELANPLFLSYSIHSNPYIRKQFNIKNRGAIMSGLNLTIIKETKIRRPPIRLQNQFAGIHLQIDEIKSHYQQSLTELNNLYGVLSQKVFKGELDLSQVPLEKNEELIQEQVIRPVPKGEENAKTINLPDPDDASALGKSEVRKELIENWINAYILQLGSGAEFVLKDFFEVAQQKVLSLLDDDESSRLGLKEYDQIKDWVFKAIEHGKISQTRNIVSEPDKEVVYGNQIILKTVNQE